MSVLSLGDGIAVEVERRETTGRTGAVGRRTTVDARRSDDEEDDDVPPPVPQKDFAALRVR